MQQLDSRRHAVRLGALIAAAAAITLAMAVTIGAGAGLDLGAVIAALGIAAVGAVGLGLMFGWRGARPCAAVLLGGAALVSLGSLVADGVPDVTAATLIDRSNAAASTVLLAWLCVAGILGLYAPARRTTQLTVRISAICLAVIAGYHLYAAALLHFDLGLHLGGFAFQFSASGTRLAGFPGWPIWHFVLFATALGLLFTPDRKLASAARTLMALFGVLAGLGLVAIVTAGVGVVELAPLLLTWGLSALPIYLCWWLRQEALQLSPLAS